MAGPENIRPTKRHSRSARDSDALVAARPRHIGEDDHQGEAAMTACGYLLFRMHSGIGARGIAGTTSSKWSKMMRTCSSRPNPFLPHTGASVQVRAQHRPGAMNAKSGLAVAQGISRVTFSAHEDRDRVVPEIRRETS